MFRKSHCAMTGKIFVVDVWSKVKDIDSFQNSNREKISCHVFHYFFHSIVIKEEWSQSDLLWWLSVITISVVELMDTSTVLCFVCLWHCLQSQIFCLFTVFSLQISLTVIGGHATRGNTWHGQSGCPAFQGNLLSWKACWYSKILPEITVYWGCSQSSVESLQGERSQLLAGHSQVMLRP